MTADQIIAQFSLKPHPEGGYFQRSYESTQQLQTERGERPSMTSIYYLLTQQSPIGHFHLNQSDILHYFHSGDPITYYLIDPDSKALTQSVLGNNLAAGESPQLLVRGGQWKASRLQDNGTCGYGLISEAVSPGFDYADMTLGAAVDLLQRFPAHRDLIPKLSHP